MLVTYTTEFKNSLAVCGITRQTWVLGLHKPGLAGLKNVQVTRGPVYPYFYSLV